MLEVKQKVIDRLNELKTVQFPQPTALQLHSPKAMMGRVQRQSNRLYKQRIAKQQKDYQLKLAKINKYYADLQIEEQRRANLLAAYEKEVSLLNTFEDNGTLLQAPVFQPIGLVVPKPVIGINGKPIRRQARIHSRKKAKGLRRVR